VHLENQMWHFGVLPSGASPGRSEFPGRGVHIESRPRQFETRPLQWEHLQFRGAFLEGKLIHAVHVCRCALIESHA
jgi:hypothetical protein